MLNGTLNSKYVRFFEIYGQDSFYMAAGCASAAAGSSVDEIREYFVSRRKG
jgi:hypothetical protein